MPKQERIDFRVDAEIKAQFVEAAESLGMNLSAFIIAAAQELAARAQRRSRTMVLSEADRDRFLAALDRAARPAPSAMEKAKRLHRELVTGE